MLFSLQRKASSFGNDQLAGMLPACERDIRKQAGLCWWQDTVSMSLCKLHSIAAMSGLRRSDERARDAARADNEKQKVKGWEHPNQVTVIAPYTSGRYCICMRFRFTMPPHSGGTVPVGTGLGSGIL